MFLLAAAAAVAILQKHLSIKKETQKPRQYCY